MMHSRVIAHSVSRVLVAAVVATTVAVAIATTLATGAGAQGARPPGDTATGASLRRDTLESVVIRATRTPAAPAAARATISRDQLQRTAAGHDAPLVLASTPSATVYSEAGGYSGYSYIRLRGLDQTRLNITLDGVPLNDPEDQVLYFSNVPDFLGSISSVEVGRGVGASTFGTASFAGSLNFRSVPLATTPRSAQVELTAGSFNTWRTSVQGTTGVGPGGFAAHGRLSRQGTDGYREHSGNDAWSGFGSMGWFGARDALKVSVLAGSSGTRLAYLAASESDLAVNRRINPLTGSEGDRFHQEMVSMQYSRALARDVSATVMTYRNSAAGAYDVSFGADPGGGLSIGNFALAHVWYGATAALTWTTPEFALATGATLSDYHREHALAMRPALTDRTYANTGVKRDAAGFMKLTWNRGPFRFGADLNVRRAAFRYRPSANAGIAPASVSWTFANPRAGVTWTVSPGVSLYATAGRTSREPARGDLFAGADDLNADNAADLIPLDRVRPEELNDFEGGIVWHNARGSVALNAFDMEFRNEIAAIGALSLTGSPLRKNVPRSYRRGVELEGAYRFHELGTLTANLAAMRSRIAEYADGASGKLYHDVEPVMSPPVIGNVRWDVPLTGPWSVAVGGRYVSRAHLANDGNPALVTPAYSLVDVALRWTRGDGEVRVDLNNALDGNAYAGGYTDGTSRYFYPIASRNVLLTLRVPLGR